MRGTAGACPPPLATARSPPRPRAPTLPPRAPLAATDTFYYASAFNQPLDSWNTTAVTSMEGKQPSPLYLLPAYLTIVDGHLGS